MHVRSYVMISLLSDSDIQPLAKDGYVCAACNSLCLVYLPQEINEKLSIETVTDTSIHPKIASYEILISPVVCITPHNRSMLLEKPAIIEFTKSVELSDKDQVDNKVIPLYANSESSEWKELGSDCNNCRELNDRISFEVSHFSLFAVISRKPYPKSTVKVKPSANIATPDQPSSPAELTIPVFEGFKVQIPPSSINADRETDVTATVLYDCPAVCSEDDRSRLASSCIELEPHGITFSKPVSISMPLPNYAQVKENHPDAQLQIFWHSDTDTEREPVKHTVCQDKEGRYVAIVQTNHFSKLIPMWTKRVASHLFSIPFKIRARCQVFMSQEMHLPYQSRPTSSIAIHFYSYKKKPHAIPDNYKHMLVDSNLLKLTVLNSDTIQFGIEFNEDLKCEPNAIIEEFAISGSQEKSFIIHLGASVELPGGFPVGKLSIGVKEGLEKDKHTLILMKVRLIASRIVMKFSLFVCSYYSQELISLKRVS